MRQERNLSQVELAEKAGISRGYLNEIEHGRRENISLKIVCALAEVLGVTITELLKDD